MQARRKSRPSPTVAEKPGNEEEVPLWKRELAERRKHRADPITAIESIKVGAKHDDDEVIPPWKLEIEERKKRSLSSGASNRGTC
jgi:hypothetical protein